jgi:O-antigen ligase
MLPLIPLAIDRLFNEKKMSRRVFAAWALFVCILTVMVTFSRGAFVAMMVMLIIIFLLNKPRPSVVVATVGMVIVLMQFVPAQYTERLRTLLDFIPGFGDPNAVVEEASFQGRSNQLEVGLLVFADHPIFGIGMENVKAVFFEYSRILGNVDSREERAIHNYYLEIAVERGIVGLLAFGILMFGVYRGVMYSRKHLIEAGDMQYAGMVTALGIGLIGYFIAATFLHDAYNRYFWLLIGIALALPEVVKRKIAYARAQIKAKN